MSEPYGLMPFDLKAPEHLLMPGGKHDREHTSRSVQLGDGDDAATLELTEWGACRPGCRGRSLLGSHGAGHRLVLLVPCDGMPHCRSCECGNGHVIHLSAEQEAALKALIP